MSKQIFMKILRTFKYLMNANFSHGVYKTKQYAYKIEKNHFQSVLNIFFSPLSWQITFEMSFVL